MLIESQFFLTDGTKVPGTIEIQDSSLRIAAGSIVESWDHGRIDSKIGGAANKLVFLSTTASSQVTSLYFERNAENLKQFSGLKHSAYQAIFTDDRTEKRRFYLALLGTFSSIALLIYLIFMGWYPLLDAMVDRFPYSIEKQLGDKLIELALPTGKKWEHPKVHETLTQQMQTIIEQLPKEMRDIKLHLSQDEAINAFALPGGHMIFNRGLLRSAHSIEEVLGVAAHELAHIHQRHSTKTLIHSLGLFLAIDILLGDISGAIAVIVDNGHLLLQRGFSRSYEMEADEQGYLMLTKANISPQGMIDFFRTLEKESMKIESEGLEEALTFLSTHPATKERIETLQKRINKDAQKIPLIDFDYNGFKSLFADQEKKD